MWSVDAAGVEVADIIADASKKIRRRDLRQRLRASQSELERNHTNYDYEAAAGSYHAMTATRYRLDKLTDAEVEWVYTNHLAKARGGAREHYERMISAASFELCSYCQYGQATTLDHFVPKSVVGGLSIEPLNLVPACSQCNHKLNAYTATSSLDELFHPFYESVESRWLFAHVLPGETVSIEFFPQPDPSLGDEVCARIRNQFSALGLALMYAGVSGRDIAEAKETLGGRLVSDDESSSNASSPRDPRRIATHSRRAASDLLKETAEIAFRVDANSRRGAVYEALAADDRFCSGGFLQR